MNIFRFVRPYTPGAGKDDLKHYAINLDTIKAIQLPISEIQLLRKAAGWGIGSKATAEKALASKKTGYISDHKRTEAAKTIEIFRRITE